MLCHFGLHPLMLRFNKIDGMFGIGFAEITVARHNCDKTQHETKHAQSCVGKIAIKIC
jgi:hypothetical protein